jgi:type IX secretion system PorP/SprF family membrane protein
MKSIKYIFISISIGLAPILVMAQVDPHFSQFYAYPVWLNPALTGAIDGDYRVTAIHRNQWASVTDAFNTVGVTGEYVTNKNINIGGNFISQTAGNGGYRYTNAYVSVAYTGLKLGSQLEHRVVFGLQAGIISRAFDPTKMRFGTQWNPLTGFDPGIPSQEVLNNPSHSTFDMNLGVAYYNVSPDTKLNFFGGIAAAHVTSPSDPFISNGNKQSLPMRLTAHGGARYQWTDKLAIVPNFIFMNQGNATQTMIGAYAQIAANEVTDLMIGTNLRLGDAFSPFVGVNYNNFVLGFSYDINTSDLGRMVNGTNSFEISLSFLGRTKKEYRNERFPCPRL